MQHSFAVVMILLALGCQRAPAPVVDQKDLKPEPKINFYKGPADGKKIELHLQGGFTGERIEILYNDIPLLHGDPKSRNTLGLATIFEFTIGAEETGKLTIRTPQLQSTQTFAWDKGAHIAINLGDKVHWEQAEKTWGYK